MKGRAAARYAVRERPASGLWTVAERPHYDGPLLLDTHVWIWWLERNESQISPATRELLNSATAAGQLMVCDISFWELALKAAKGRIALSLEPMLWLRRAERAPGITYIPLEREILLGAAALPSQLHGDPADRMMLAAAQLRGLSLVTVDRNIIAYAASRPGVPVCDARPAGRVRERARKVTAR